EFVFLGQLDGNIDLQARIPGFDFDGLVIPGNGVFVLVPSSQRAADVKVIAGPCWRILDRVTKAGGGFVDVALFEKSQTQWAVCEAVIRHLLYGIAVGGYGSVQIAFVAKGIPESDQDPRVSRPHCQGRREVANGLVQPGALTVVQNTGEVLIGPEVVGVGML